VKRALTRPDTPAVARFRKSSERNPPCIWREARREQCTRRQYDMVEQQERLKVGSPRMSTSVTFDFVLEFDALGVRCATRGEAQVRPQVPVRGDSCCDVIVTSRGTARVHVAVCTVYHHVVGGKDDGRSGRLWRTKHIEPASFGRMTIRSISPRPCRLLLPFGGGTCAAGKRRQTLTALCRTARLKDARIDAEQVCEEGARVQGDQEREGE
jgi:hypothetical protein